MADALNELYALYRDGGGSPVTNTVEQSPDARHARLTSSQPTMPPSCKAITQLVRRCANPVRAQLSFRRRSNVDLDSREFYSPGSCRACLDPFRLHTTKEQRMDTKQVMKPITNQSTRVTGTRG